MITYVRSLLAVSAVIMLTFSGNATAGKLSVSEQEFLGTWDDLDIVYDSTGTTLECNVTLGGSFHSRTFNKTSGSLVGSITRATVNTCVNGITATVLAADLPWHYRFNSFTGTLPNVTGVLLQIVNMGIRIAGPDIPPCLFRTDATEPAGGTANVVFGQLRTFTADPDFAIDLQGGFLCELAGDASLAGTGSLSSGDNVRLVFIRLI
jgi:hypothetical protein